MPMTPYATSAGKVGGGSPCWNKGAGCPARQAGCHADCEKYAAWKAEADKQRDRIIAEVNRKTMLDDHVIRSKHNFGNDKTHHTKGGGRRK